MAGLMANPLARLLVAVVLSGAISGWYFSGVAANRVKLSYEKQIADINEQAKKKYDADVALIAKNADAALAKERARRDKIKPVEREVIKYVTQYKANDSSECVVTANGLQFLSRYLAASASPEG